MLRIARSLSSSLLLLVAAGACQEPGPELKKPAEHISEVSDTISATGDIVVRFVNDEATPDQINVPMKKRVFTFTPRADGLARWTDRRTLTFHPQSRLKPGQTYTAVLDLDALLPAKKLGSFAFKVAVPSLELAEARAEFVPAGNDPTRVDLKGTLRFTQAVEQDALKDAVQVTEERGKEQALAWQVQDNTATFVVANLKRGKEARRFHLKIDGKALGTPQSRDDVYDLPPAQDFVISSVSWTIDGDKPQIKITMSDPIADRLDLAGFVTVEPQVKTSVTYSGKEILLTGDFALGASYQVTVKPGIKSRWNTATQASKTETVQIANQVPAVQFSQAGVFVPSGAKQRIAFKSVNLKKVRVSVAQVFENNLSQFLQTAHLASGKKDRNELYELNRVGTSLLEQTLELDAPKNTWVQSELDLGPILAKQKRGLFIVELRFGRDDIAFACKEQRAEEHGELATVPGEGSGYWYWEGPNDYYNNPCQHGFYYSHGKISKPVVFTDIGLTAKVGASQTVVVATDLNTAEPLAGVTVTTTTYQNQAIDSGTTDASGVARLDNKGQTAFLVQAEWRDQKNLLKLSDGALDLSSFDTGGTVDMDPGVRAYTYTERGVYRPGNPIHLTAILRHPDNTFPKDLPVELKLTDPRGQQARSMIERRADDGVYVFTIETRETDYTGTWQAGLFVGSKQVASTPLKIETIVPNRLKVWLDFGKERLGPGDQHVAVGISSTYLFGAPANGLDAKATLTVSHRRKTAQKFSDFVFDGWSGWKATSVDLETRLAENGKGTFDWALPDTRLVPSALSLRVEARVFEKGGRYTPARKTVDIEPWERYVGLKSPAGEVRVDQPTKLDFVLVDMDGKPVSDRPLKVRVYANKRYWWWHYDSDTDPETRFKSDHDTLLFFEQTVTSGSGPVSTRFTAKEYGQVLIEVQDGDTGHKASTLTYTYGWHREEEQKSASQLSLNLDQKVYHPGETATVRFSTPPKGRALVTVERAGRVLSLKWVDVTAKETAVQLPVTEEMLPNAYAAVSFIQPHAETQNDRPMRLYGVANLPVEQAETHLKLSLEVKDELAPKAPFAVNIRSNDDRPVQVTVAVVDEGLLDITGFATPNPWDAFFAKRPIGVATYDLFDRVIGPVWGDLFKRFSIGGSESSGEERKQLIPVKAQRFKPVSLFKGPLVVPPRGVLEVPFEMPNYNGSVRVMVIAAHRNAYASLEATRPVRKPLLVFASLPRVVGPKDSFELPITLFGLRPDVGAVDVTVETDGPLEIVGDAKRKVVFKAVGEQDVGFKLRGKPEVGVAHVRILAKSARYEASDETELAVRPSSPSITDHNDKVLEPNAPWTVDLTPKGLRGTHKAQAVLTNVPNMNYTHRYDWIIHYPYGCAEQTASAAFPQLNVAKLFPNLLRVEHIDRNINAAIARLASMQYYDGSFRYWPYYYYWYEYYDWLASYVGHFLLAAKQKGYHVPPETLERWVTYQQRRASHVEHPVPHAYLLYTLALAGKPDLGAMNVLKERLAGLPHPARLLLAGAYELTGAHDTAKQMVAGIDQIVADTQGFDRSFGSDLRDDALSLELFTLIGEKERAFKAYERIAKKLSGWGYYDTHGLAWALLSAGNYVSSVGLGRVQMKVRIEGAGAAVPIVVDTQDYGATVDLTPYIGKRVTLTSSSSKPVYGSIVEDYVPLEPPPAKVSDSMGLAQDLYDEDGAPLSAAEIEQGRSFWLVLRVGSHDRRDIKNVALTQVLPAGWEIENTRLTGESRPEWMRQHSYWYYGSEQYVDIRDDRVIWFFNLSGQTYWNRDHAQVFVVKLNAVTQGEYLLPPTFAEAMYNADFRARLAPQTVKVTAP